MQLSLFDLAAVFLALAAAIGWLNQRTIRAPPAVAMLLVGLTSTFALAALDFAAPGLGVERAAAQLMRQVDFSAAVLRFMLAFLLFAGAMHVDVDALRQRAWTAAVLATAGVAISALTVAGGFWLAARLAGAPLSFGWALVFGCLVSPTDPVGVLATLKRTSLKADLRALIEGEALFNDGVGVVLFSAAVALAAGQGATSPAVIGLRVVTEAGGGAMLGFAVGQVAVRAMQTIDDYGVEVGITLAAAMGTYSLASALGVSGPIGVVLAGLLLGHREKRQAMSQRTRRYTRAFWAVVDDNLNGVLFLLLGLEVVVLRFDSRSVLIAAAAIPLIFLGRWASLAGPALLLRLAGRPIAPALAALLTWAGVRGGLSVAMALSLPAAPERAVILAATYAAVIFSIVVQSLTLERVVLRLGYGRPPSTPAGS
ncbi:MAG: sodium:proton antiporter [Caulobacteraceae bacterium]|nr:sodium:proton antiporter [Caulobacteraceae bacterium]